LIIKKRIKQIKLLGDKHYITKEEKQTNRLSKRHAFGCHRSQCKTCHHDKFDDKIRERL